MASTLGTGPAAWDTEAELVGRGLTPCMPCSFGPLPHPRSGTCTPTIGPLEVTVGVRWIPLVTAAYGTRVARPTRTTRLARGGDGSQLARRVRPVLGDRCLVGKSPEGSRQPGWETRTLARLLKRCLVAAALAG
jgi:hypothetical protein